MRIDSNQIQFIPTMEEGIIVVDTNSYNHLVGYVLIDCLELETTLESKYTPFTQSVGEGVYSKFRINKNGTYNYVKIVIPTIETVLAADPANIYNKIFIANNNIYLGTSIDEVDTATSAVAASTKINFAKAYDLIYNDSNVDSGGYCTEIIKTFTSCPLKSCILELRKQRIAKETCKFDGCGVDFNQQALDFLICADAVIDHYVSKGELIKAQYIVDNIESCGDLCNTDTHPNNCNCG